MQWTLESQKTVLTTPPINVEELQQRDQRSGKMLHPFYRLVSADWVNILPITAQNEAILIWQSRAGSQQDVLEIPGGAVDPQERDLTMAAARELEEETGFTSQRILPIGAMNPNPALQNNRLHMFLALGCTPASVRRHFPDASEEIRVELFPVAELDAMVRQGRIDSCLSALTIMLAAKYLQNRPATANT